jgi:hypothetical protein
VARIRPIGGSALGQLAALVDLHDRGLREPFPLPPGRAPPTPVLGPSPATPSGRRARSGRPIATAREDDDADHVLAFGGRLPFEDLLAVAPHADEEGPGWDEAEPSRFGRLACACGRPSWPSRSARTCEHGDRAAAVRRLRPLPSGVTVLEASAGTGKTFTIAGLTARYVAEGVAPEELLVMTFTRNATAELRDRVRERLVSAEQGLDRVLAGEPVDASDGVLASWRPAASTRSARGSAASPPQSPTSTPPRS